MGRLNAPENPIGLDCMKKWEISWISVQVKRVSKCKGVLSKLTSHRKLRIYRSYLTSRANLILKSYESHMILSAFRLKDFLISRE